MPYDTRPHMIISQNPATEEEIERFDGMSEQDVEEALVKAHALFPTFSSRKKLSERTERLTALGELLRQNKDELAKLMTLEMGKPITQAKAEVEKSATCCDYYAKNAEAILKDRVIESDNKSSYVRWLPIGPVLAVMPWNFPLWQVIRFAAPALAAGNVCLLKHASNVPKMALRIEELCLEAGFPVGAFQTLLIGSSMVEGVIQDSRVKGVTLTGSEPAGRAVAERAGANLKPSVLELGGADPFIIMPSADLDAAVKMAVKARTQNTGQSCIAAKRFIVHEKIHAAFLDKFIHALEKLKVDNPLFEDTDIGPLATKDIRDELAEQVDSSVRAGADIAFQGKAPEGPGHWYPPTVLIDIPEDCPAAIEELFGPVASVFKVESLDEAIDLANSSRFGLGSAAWTKEKSEQAEFIDRLEAGFTAINGMTTSDPRLPFGGIKDSGYGRELSNLGMREFLNAKTITVN